MNHLAIASIAHDHFADTTIPLAEVVDSFQIFFTNQGSQGKLGNASNQQLENVFGTSKDVDAITVLLQKGTLQSGKGTQSLMQPS